MRLYICCLFIINVMPSTNIHKSRIFDLGGSGLKMAKATLSHDGSITINEGKVTSLGQCPPDMSTQTWIHYKMPDFARDIYLQEKRFGFSLAGVDKLWADKQDRSRGRNVPEMLGLPKSLCMCLSDGQSHLLASIENARRNNISIIYPVWNLAIGTGVGFAALTHADGQMQNVCDSAWQLPCVDNHNNTKMVYKILGGEFNENRNLHNESTLVRRDYERQCIQFINLTIRNHENNINPVSCIPKTVIFTGGLIDHNSSLFNNDGNGITSSNIRYMRGPKHAGLLGAAYISLKPEFNT